MGQFVFENTSIEGLKIVTPFYAEDHRGYFLKNFEKEMFRKNGISFDLHEDFESLSNCGVIRGLHFQTKQPQMKLVRALWGEIFDVAVDLRQNSSTFGRWEGTLLSGNNKRAFLIPRGFAHGFLTLSENALVNYKCDGKFFKEYDTGIVWDDYDLAIQWPLEQVDHIIVSQRDRDLPSFREYQNRLSGVDGAQDEK